MRAGVVRRSRRAARWELRIAVLEMGWVASKVVLAFLVFAELVWLSRLAALARTCRPGRSRVVVGGGCKLSVYGEFY